MPLIFGIDTITLDPATTQGVVPVGTVLSVMSDIAGGFSIPASGVIDGGFMLCDGVAIPGGNPLNGNTPNMTGDIYLRGSTVAGVAASANTKVLNTPQLPSHVHGASSNTVNAPHGHTASGGTANAPHGHSASPNGLVNAPHNQAHAHGRTYASQAGGANITNRVSIVNTQTPTQTITGHPSNAPANAPHNTPAGTVPVKNIPHSHPVSVVANNAPHSHTVTVTATGSGDAFDIQPNYITCQYIIRVA